MHNCLERVLTLQEASTLYGRDASTLRNAIRRGVFAPDEIKQSGATWLVTKAAMDRVYGIPEEAEETASAEGFHIHCPRCASRTVLALSNGTLECGDCDLHFTVQVLK